MTSKILITSPNIYSSHSTVSLHDDTINENIFETFTPDKGSEKFSPILKYFNDILNTGSLSKDSGIMPPGFLGANGNYLVFERPPEYKNVFVIPKVVSEISDTSEPYVYRIPIPWTIYFVQISSVFNPDTGKNDYYPSNVRMQFMKTNLRDINQDLYLAPIPNFYSNGNLCRPMFSSMEDIERYTKDFAGCIEAAYDWIWNCGTNLDLTESVVQMYTQFTDKDISNTVFRTSYTTIPYKLSPRSYYTGITNVDALFQAWQKIDINEVCELSWPVNSLETSFHTNYNDTYDRLPEYLRSINQEPHYDYHFDEESEENYQCEDMDCECHQILNSYNYDDYINWLGFPEHDPVTYAQSFERFVSMTSPKKTFHGYNSAYALFANTVSVIRLS